MHSFTDPHAPAHPPGQAQIRVRLESGMFREGNRVLAAQI
jgi:hypothetical protein